MYNSSPSDDNPLDVISSQEILDGFSRLHQLVLVANRRGQIVWTSDEMGVLCGGADRLAGIDVNRLLPRLPRPDQITSIRSQLRSRDSLRQMRLELSPREGRKLAVNVSAFRIESRDQNGPLVVAIVSPITPSDSERTRLTKNAELLSDVLEASPHAMIAFDEARFITFANPAAEKLLGMSAEDLNGKPCSLVLPKGVLDGQLSSAQQAAPPQGEGAPEENEVELHLAEGTHRWVSIITRALQHADGEPAGGVAILRDVSGPKHWRDKIERKNAELESYVHSVSHDLRSPLVSLLGFTRLLRQDYETMLDDSGRHFLDRIEQAGRTMEALIHDLLELSRIGEPEGRRSLVDPRAVLQQLQAELKPRLDAGRVSLQVPENIPFLLCDQTRLYQLFSNLVGNAIEHMGPCENPQISVEVLEEPTCHRISVRDNGRGIALDQQERIFEVFQTIGAKADGERSTGIGLAIVKKIAEAHEGDVWVDSEPGRGATFHVRLAR